MPIRRTIKIQIWCLANLVLALLVAGMIHLVLTLCQYGGLHPAMLSTVQHPGIRCATCALAAMDRAAWYRRVLLHGSLMQSVTYVCMVADPSRVMWRFNSTYRFGTPSILSAGPGNLGSEAPQDVAPDVICNRVLGHGFCVHHVH